MNEGIDIRPALKEEIEQLVELGARTFDEAFSKDNDPENMAIYMNGQFNVARMTEEFNEKDNLFIVAILNGQMIGYAKLCEHSATGDLDPASSMEIQRIYVLQAFYGVGAGASLMQYSLEHAVSRGFRTVWLGVWEHNHRAVEFYKRWGFDVFGRHVFMLGHDAQEDVLMKKTMA